MKPPIVLLFSCDSQSQQAVEDAVLATRHGLRVVRTSREAFRILREDHADVDVAVIDLDPGMHGSALLEAAAQRLPVIALTGLEENYMAPLARSHGAVACIAKPFTAEALAAAIKGAEHHAAAA